ncbi:MAG: hypothetical protein QM756_44715 [Polyangiaceae bacterium]
MKRRLADHTAEPDGLVEREDCADFPSAANRLAAGAIAAALRGDNLADLGGIINMATPTKVQVVLATRALIAERFPEVAAAMPPCTELQVYVTDDKLCGYMPLSRLTQRTREIEQQEETQHGG